MTIAPLSSRQAIGCGHAPPDERIPVVTWTPTGWKHKQPTTCVGYTTKLPEVIEIARARFHWDKGALEQVLDGEPATEGLLRGVEVLASAYSEVQSWRSTPASKGGGGPG